MQARTSATLLPSRTGVRSPPPRSPRGARAMGDGHCGVACHPGSAPASSPSASSAAWGGGTVELTLGLVYKAVAAGA